MFVVSYLARPLGLLGVQGCGEKLGGLVQVQRMRLWRWVLVFSLAPCTSNAPLPRSAPAARSNSMVVRGGLWGGPRVPEGRGEGPAQGLLRSPTQPGSESLALTHSPSPAPPNFSSVGNKVGGQVIAKFPPGEPWQVRGDCVSRCRFLGRGLELSSASPKRVRCLLFFFN